MSRCHPNMRSLLSAIVVACAGAPVSAAPLGTAFTYQGKLNAAGSPVDATADFQFRLFDAASAGNLVAGPVSVSSVDVVEGLFTATVDFSAAAFNGQARWLEVAARSPAGAGSFTALSPRQPLTAAPYALKVPGIDGHSLDAADGSPTDALFVNDAGNVGIGTSSPNFPVSLGSNLSHTKIALYDASATNHYGMGVVSGQFSFHLNGPGARYAFYDSNDLTNEVLTIRGSGNVGIGVLAPTSKLEIAGQNGLAITGIQPFFTLRDTNAAGKRGIIQSVNGQLNFFPNSFIGGSAAMVVKDTTGNVGVGTDNPTAKLDVNGTTRTKVLEITGADLAEKFPTSHRVEPGTVVAIDPENPGMLCEARGAYNRRVAGVVSGANNFSAGAVLGNLPGCAGAPPIALSGRVWVNCDAGEGAIQLGDLLTSSDTPGHAMKVTDFARAQGACIGKAMTSLPSGHGLVLVLVSLQ